MIRLPAAAALALLAGCAGFSADGGFDAVGGLVQERTGTAPVWQRGEDQDDSSRARTEVLLRQPLTADGAVEVALLNNRGLQAGVAVGQMRAFEFNATAGDWALHCHKSHHTMNVMGHAVPTMIGVDHRGVAEKIARLVPDYMVMGERGMADMGAMKMPLPENTLAMMSGAGPFGPLEMGGMFTVVKVRDEQKTGDDADPGWFRHPPGTVAYEWHGDPPSPARASAPQADASTGRVRKPGQTSGSHEH